MNKKLALIFLSSPTVFGSMLSVLLTVNPAHAAESIPLTTNPQSCTVNPHGLRLTCARLSQTTQIASTSNSTEVKAVSSNSAEETPMIQFTEEESDAAIILFGCDCPICINAIRQMRGLPPVF